MPIMPRVSVPAGEYLVFSSAEPRAGPVAGAEEVLLLVHEKAAGERGQETGDRKGHQLGRRRADSVRLQCPLVLTDADEHVWKAMGRIGAKAIL